ncbi:hypothetical protein [Verrucomicrobium sp. BvORR034]|uniref:hypothetical protein n=1 Tax=Verrucomicrobium sp. BvORR034 TaxID=1396418 RepID=UPI000678D9B9|nr:hypothetical protein [Verrucomicrobium sp. BvORR034]
MNNNLCDPISHPSRRQFMKMAGLAALPAAISGVSAEEIAGEASGAFIRVRRNGSEQGWRYHRVRTVQRYYPKSEEEPKAQLSQYGGNASVQWKASGKFRAEKVDGRWWLVDPDGHPFLSKGINTISPDGSDEVSKVVEQMGGVKSWSEKTVAQLKNYGFNSAGNWSATSVGDAVYSPIPGIPFVYFDFGQKGDPEIIRGRRPNGLMECFAAGLRVRDPIKRGVRFPAFHPGFEAFCAERCQRVAALKDDPWLIGYFSDNELMPPSLDGYLKISVDDPLYGECGREARRWWAERGKKIIREEDSAAWAAHAFEWYYRITTAAIRKHDPDHLQLGSRYYSWERNLQPMWEVAGKYLDVVSVNPYGMDVVMPGQLRQWSRWAGNKPVLIGEFYVKGHDSNFTNAGGAGDLVATQEERGLFYQNYTLALLQSAVCVGWHWHRYADDAVMTTNAETVRSNKGIVSASLVPYERLLEGASEINLRAYEIADKMGSAA